MRICPNCGGVAHVEYVYQTIACRQCGKTWTFDEYKREYEIYLRDGTN